MKRAPIKVLIDWTDVVIHSVTFTVAGSAFYQPQVALGRASKVLSNRATRHAVPRPRRLVQIAARLH